METIEYLMELRKNTDEKIINYIELTFDIKLHEKHEIIFNHDKSWRFKSSFVKMQNHIHKSCLNSKTKYCDCKYEWVEDENNQKCITWAKDNDIENEWYEDYYCYQDYIMFCWVEDQNSKVYMIFKKSNQKTD